MYCLGLVLVVDPEVAVLGITYLLLYNILLKLLVSDSSQPNYQNKTKTSDYKKKIGWTKLENILEFFSSLGV